ncbi:MAG TPA: hypothetical protein VFX05_05710 [Casimicrobiaceae bacterium]|nr:hypothetical protein [Casimicrobiaceae bacterium]
MTARSEPVAEPLVWTFDGPLGLCLADVEDTLRRAIVQLDDVAALVAALDLSLPALARRVAAGEPLQPAWRTFLERVSRVGLPSPLRVRPRPDPGPLVTLVLVYRS